MLNKKLQNCSLGILLLVTSLLSSKAFSEYVKLDGIVAVVDEDVVLASELLERINLVRESMIQNKVPMPERDVFVGQVLDRLIIENIQLQEATIGVLLLTTRLYRKRCNNSRKVTGRR